MEFRIKYSELRDIETQCSTEEACGVFLSRLLKSKGFDLSKPIWSDDDYNTQTVVFKQKDIRWFDSGKVTDGYHTFDELYYHRMMLFAVICRQNRNRAWKSWKHHDGTMYDDDFIVGVSTKAGQYSYHYHKDYWDFFKVQELERAPEWDGHKPEDVTRLMTLPERR